MVDFPNAATVNAAALNLRNASPRDIEHFRIGNAPILKDRAIFPIT